MNAETIDILAALDPKAKIPNISVANLNHLASPLHDEAMTQFMSCYCNVAFGWYIASQFSNAIKGFPMAMLGRDHWVFKAFLMQLDPWSFYDKHVATAYHLAHTPPGSPDLGSNLKALILSVRDFDPVIHIQRVATITGLHYKTVEAFEMLFFNILDRRLDGFYIAAELYPKSRLVELAESYMADASIGDLLKRAGYNQRDLDMTSYLVGIGDKEYMAKLAASANSETELNNQIMGNGLILARANLLNTRAVGLGRSQALMVASRQSGSATDESPLVGIACQFADQFKAAAALSQVDVARRMREDAAQTVFV
jgi:hypothetical protein